MRMQFRAFEFAVHNPLHLGAMAKHTEREMVRERDGDGEREREREIEREMQAYVCMGGGGGGGVIRLHI